jgi:hypothetical protein
VTEAAEPAPPPEEPPMDIHKPKAIPNNKKQVS